MRKLVWVRADWAEPWKSRRHFVSAAIEAGADAVIIRPGEEKEAAKIGAIVLVSEKDSPAIGAIVLHVKSPADVEKVLKNSEKIQAGGKKVAAMIEVKDKESEKAAVKLGKVCDFILVTSRNWKIIPLENIIADLQGAKAEILASAKDAREAMVAVQTLEVGTAGVLLDARHSGPEEIKKTCKEFEKLATEKLKLVNAKVKHVKTVGMGDRACIDTTSLMEVGEGMLVGSQAGGLFLIHSETLPSEFVEARPFRVNAGAVHAYIKVPGGKTRYISELKAGDHVLLVNSRGESRVGIIGRVKIERRPLVLVEAEWKGRIYKTLLQNAETINLVGEKGEPKPITGLKPGDKVMIYVEAGGRHFGTKIDETMIER